MNRDDIFFSIESERQYQENKWGAEFDQGHDQYHWVAFITQEVAKAISYPELDREAFRIAMIKVASVAVASLEVIDDVNVYRGGK